MLKGMLSSSDITNIDLWVYRWRQIMISHTYWYPECVINSESSCSLPKNFPLVGKWLTAIWQIIFKHGYVWSFLVAQMANNLPQCRRPGFHLWVGKISWRREWLSSPGFLLGELHGQRILASYSPWGHWVELQLMGSWVSD